MRYEVFVKLSKLHLGRYLLVLFLFLIAYSVGRNPENPRFAQGSPQGEKGALRGVGSAIYNFPTDQNKLELKGLFSMKKNQCGRLFFSLKNISTEDKLGTLIHKKTRAKVYLSDEFDQSQEIKQIELQDDGDLQNNEIELCANADYQNLLFKKEQDNEVGAFEISNLVFYPLSIKKHNFNNLISPIVGNTDFSNVVYRSMFGADDANSVFKFTRKNQIIGQIFIANADSISGVDLKLRFIRSGGSGHYLLDLKEVSNRDGRIQLVPDRIAYYYFDKKNIEQYLDTEKGVYHIPLAARLEIGKTYFIGINNEAVKFNYFNTLEIYGRSDSSNEEIIFSINDKTRKKRSALYFQVYGTDYTRMLGEKVLTGAKILDNGDGTGQYIYEQRGEFSDYLDLEQTTAIENEIYNIFYDNVVGGVSGRARGDNKFVYKINTIYPFTIMKIEADQPGGGFTNSLVYYSFNNNDWLEIQSDSYKLVDVLPEEENSFQELILGDGKTKTVYIKVTYDKNSTGNKNIQLFGLRNLRITANLNLE